MDEHRRKKANNKGRKRSKRKKVDMQNLRMKRLIGVSKKGFE